MQTPTEVNKKPASCRHNHHQHVAPADTETVSIKLNFLPIREVSDLTCSTNETNDKISPRPRGRHRLMRMRDSHLLLKEEDESIKNHRRRSSHTTTSISGNTRISRKDRQRRKDTSQFQNVKGESFLNNESEQSSSTSEFRRRWTVDTPINIRRERSPNSAAAMPRPSMRRVSTADCRRKSESDCTSSRRCIHHNKSWAQPPTKPQRQASAQSQERRSRANSSDDRSSSIKPTSPAAEIMAPEEGTNNNNNNMMMMNSDPCLRRVASDSLPIIPKRRNSLSGDSLENTIDLLFESSMSI